MAYLNDLLRFELVYPEEVVAAKLLNSSITFNKQKNEDYGFSLRVLDEVTFYNDDNNNYNRLKAIEDDQDSCTRVLFRVYSVDDNGGQTLRQTYELPVQAGDWDADNCYVTLEPRLLHGLKCVLERQNEPVNLLDSPNRRELRFYPEGVEVQVQIQTAIAPNLSFPSYSEAPIATPAVEGWTVIKNKFGATIQGNGSFVGVGFITSGDIVTTYMRLFSDGVESPGEGYEQVPDGWAKGVITSDVIVVSEPGAGAVDPFNFQLKPVNVIQYYNALGLNFQALDNPVQTGNEQIDDLLESLDNLSQIINGGSNSVELARITNALNAQSIDNGVALKDALELFAAPCGLSIVSDFFGINPDETAPVNGAYAYAENHLHDLVIFQASDVIRATADNNATLLRLTFSQLYLNLRRFNIEVVRSPDSVLRIEHVSYRRQNRHIDLLQDYEIVKGRAKYKYSNASKPVVEVFKDKYDSNSVDFDNAAIYYDPLCSDVDTTAGDTSPNAVCNLGYLHGNAELAEDLDKQKDTIVIASIVDGLISSANGAQTGKPLLNGALSWSNLLVGLWGWDRPQRRGRVNGVFNTPVEFETTIRIREQDPVTAKMCVEPYFNEFGDDDLVRTQFGWCECDEAKFTVPAQQLEINPKF